MYQQSKALQSINYYTKKDYEARKKKYKREIILRQVAGYVCMRNTISEERKHSCNVALQNEWAATVVGKAHPNYAIYKKSADISKYKVYILGEIEDIQKQLQNKGLDVSTKQKLTETLTYKKKEIDLINVHYNELGTLLKEDKPAELKLLISHVKFWLLCCNH